MGFWGIEVNPGNPFPYHSGNVPGKLRITQATLGPGSSKERSILQCSVGNKSPIFLCSLIPKKIESCPLNLEFEEDDLIAFSVVGPQSIHLSGYFATNEGNFIRDDYESDSFGEDIAETDTEDSSDFDTEDEYDDEFIDDEEDDYPELYTTSQPPNSGVVIEEIVDDEKSNDANGQAKKGKKNKSSDSEDIRNSQRQIVLKRSLGNAVTESEDEDGFPIPTKSKSKGNIQKSEPEQEQKDQSTGNVKANAKDGNDASTLKRKVENDDQVDHMERKKKKKQKKKAKEEKARETGDDGNMGSEKPTEEVKSDSGHKNDKKLSTQRDASTHKNIVEDENNTEDKQKKKKKKKKNKETTTAVSKSDEVTKTAGDLSKSTLGSEEYNGSKSSQVRTFPNGLVIEEVEMGKPDGKRASPGNMVSVHYIGKLKSGIIFDSNVGKAPLKFRLGVGHVIKGWDVGVNGMRIGDKRRLTIPPSMGYGAAGAGGGKIPPNSWLIFDVELVAVR